jgi:hypothetical protein
MLHLKSIAIILIIAALVFLPGGASLPSVRAAEPDSGNSSATFSGVIGGCPMFPADNIWNTPINNLPVHARSAQWVNTIGRSTGFHMDFGSGT